MAVSAQDTVFPHVGNGVTTTFAYGCKLASSDDLVVYVNNLVVTSGFTVNGVGAATGGSVTFNAAPAAGAPVRLERIVELERTTDYQQNGDFLSRVVNPDFDRIWMALQQFNYLLGSAVGAVGRVLKLGTFDSNGTGSYRAQQNRIQDLGDAINEQDAMNKRSIRSFVESHVASLFDGIASGFGYFIQGGIGAIERTFQAKLRETVSVLDFGAVGDGVTGCIAAAQKAHDALPETGGTIHFPGPGKLYLFETDGVYVNITKDNVTLVSDADAWVVSPNSEDAEVKTGARYLNGFNITGNNCVVAVNMRGPQVLWNPSASNKDNLSLRNLTTKNLYNSLVSVSGTNGFGVLDVDGVIADTCRDLTSDPGNYEVLSRASNSTAPMGKLVRVNRSLFRGVSGAIDMHNVQNVMIGGGTRFEGCDISCIKLATLNNGRVSQNLVVDESVTFDGAPINPASANRHLSATGGGRAQPGTMHLGFIQVFDTVRFHGKVKNFPNEALSFLDGSFTEAVINLDGVEFENCPKAIINPQGTISIRGAKLVNADLIYTIIAIIRSMTVQHCRIVDSALNITKRGTSADTGVDVLDNDISYSRDNLAPLRFKDFGADSSYECYIDRNTIAISGSGNTLAIDAGTAGMKAIIGANNRLSAGATVSGGFFLNAFEIITSVGPQALYLLKRLNGELTLINTNSVGAQSWNMHDAALKVPVGTRFSFVQTGANSVQFTVVGGTINGATQSALSNARWSSGTFIKLGPNAWALAEYRGTWSFY